MRFHSGIRAGRSAALPLCGALLLLALVAPVGAQTPFRRPGEEAPKGPRFGGAVLVDLQGGALRDPVRVAQLAEELAASPFTDAYVQVRAYGDAYYRSSIVPTAYGVAETDGAAPFDPLAALLKANAASKRPVRVHAWIETLRVGNSRREAPDADTHAGKAHPEWFTRNASLDNEDAEGNRYLEPGLTAVQDHLAAVAAELVGKYEIAGLLVDGMRYPGFDAAWGYHDEMLDAWRKATGSTGRPDPADTVWCDMRRAALDKAVKGIVEAARKARPGVEIALTGLAEGPAPRQIAEFALTPVFAGAQQDWPTWMASKVCDRLLVLNLEDEGSGAEVFDAWNYFAGLAVQQTGVEAKVVVAGFDNISVDALNQFRRARESGLEGAVLAYHQTPVEDLASKSSFYRGLGATVLGEKSVRAAWPTESPTLASSPWVQPRAATPEPAPVETAPVETASAPEDPLEALPAPEVFKGVYTSLIRPEPEAVSYLKTKFKNIF